MKDVRVKSNLWRDSMAREKSGRLSVIGMAIGVGIYWGLSMAIAGWTSMFDWGNGFVSVMSSIYIGYEASFIGGIIGGIWGFFDGFIAGALVAFFYNRFKK
jgi:hypothetical protein